MSLHAASSDSVHSSGKKLVEDANLQGVSTRIGCVMGHSNKILTKILEGALETPPTIMAMRSKLVGDLRAVQPAMASLWDKRFAAAAATEKECDDFVSSKGAGADELQTDTLGQLIFTSPDWAPFNYIPYMLLVISYFKRFFVPASILFFPLVAIIFPYILLRFIYKLPITYSQYFIIIKTLWIGKNGSFTNPQSLIQLAFTIFSFAQSMLEPLKQAWHLHKTDRVILSMGTKFQDLVAAVRAFQADCDTLGISKRLTIGFEDIPTTSREATAFFLDQPERLAIIKTDLAELEIFWRFSQAHAFKNVRFLREIATPKIFFRARGLADISLFEGKKSDCIFSPGKNHVVLTGPNGGGKSSFLRSLIQATLFSHSIGMAMTDELTLRPIAWIASGIRLHDSPGKLSMFETEVKFAAEALRRSKNSQNGFILFDELFHSTNPPDGEKTSTAFLKELWKSDSVMSIVSTHMFSLADNGPIQKWCFTAAENDGRLVYDYTLKRGVCRLSSVKDIWDTFGFTSACAESPPLKTL